MVRSLVTCFECSRLAEFDHHVVPRSAGGTKTVPLCCECHGKAHAIKMSSRSLTRSALHKKKAKGERVGTVPFGWNVAADGVTLTINETEQRALEIIKRLRSSGLSLRRIATELEALGILTKKGKVQWDHTAVASILERNRVSFVGVDLLGDSDGTRDGDPAGA